jgi:hypothetical protein
MNPLAIGRTLSIVSPKRDFARGEFPEGYAF